MIDWHLDWDAYPRHWPDDGLASAARVRAQSQASGPVAATDGSGSNLSPATAESAGCDAAAVSLSLVGPSHWVRNQFWPKDVTPLRRFRGILGTHSRRGSQSAPWSRVCFTTTALRAWVTRDLSQLGSRGSIAEHEALTSTDNWYNGDSASYHDRCQRSPLTLCHRRQSRLAHINGQAVFWGCLSH